jgi:putative membrane protein
MSDDQKADPRVPLAEDRTAMASYRTSLALDRTTLAWIRTTITFSTFGLGTIGYFRSLRQSAETPRTIRLHEGAIQFGVVLVVLGLVATILVAISHFLALRKLRVGKLPELSAFPLSITVSVLLALLMLYELWQVFGLSN